MRRRSGSINRDDALRTAETLHRKSADMPEDGFGLTSVVPTRFLRSRILVRSTTNSCHAERPLPQWRFVPTTVLSTCSISRDDASLSLSCEPSWVAWETGWHTPRC